jgi:hypothetical protein
VTGNEQRMHKEQGERSSSQGKERSAPGNQVAPPLASGGEGGTKRSSSGKNRNNKTRTVRGVVLL